MIFITIIQPKIHKRNGFLRQRIFFHDSYFNLFSLQNNFLDIILKEAYFFLLEAVVHWDLSEAVVNPLSSKLTKWPYTLKQFVGNLPTNCLSVFGHFVGLALKRLTLILFFISSDTFHLVISLSCFNYCTFYVSLFDSKILIRPLLNLFLF